MGERMENEIVIHLKDDVKNKIYFIRGGQYNPYAFTEQGIYMLMTVLERLSKKKKGVIVTIYTDPKTKITSQDIQKFNAQYPSLTLNHTTKMHDRFLITDNKILYHIGASLKDLGKKCFAFEILDSSLIPMILQNV